MTTELPFGSWPSPITAEVIVSASVGLGGPGFADGDIWWSELRPSEAGRVQIVRKPLDGGPSSARDVLPDGFSARTRVHEYGGGAWWLHDATNGDGVGGPVLFFTNWTDQRLYRLDGAGRDDAGAPVAITPEPVTPHALRWADGILTADGRWIICVRERHDGDAYTDVCNELVALPADGSGEAVVLVGGEPAVRGGDAPDFVASPRLSPDGTTLAYLTWNHPDMPWDRTDLVLARFGTDDDGKPALDRLTSTSSAQAVSYAQPEFAADGTPYVVADWDGDWRIRFQAFDQGPIVPGGQEWAQPQWVFGQSWYGFTDEGRGLVAVSRRDGRDHLWRAQRTSDEASASSWDRPVELDVPFTAYDGITVGPGDRVGAIAGSFTDEPQVVEVDPATAAVTVHRPARDLGIGRDWFSVPEHLEVPIAGPVSDGAPTSAFVLFYAPTSPTHGGPDGELPPLIVFSHGGPTSAARPQLNLAIQFWTSRGFAVADVNYRGSTGYGRAYRDALQGTWGIADVDDCVATARHLAALDRVDGRRLAIRGGSAGGYTTLCALTFHDDFSVGTSLYGVADLEALARDTHKFEARYLDGLVGPYPEDRATYVERSPIHHTDRLATPLLILQGLEDEIVPPNQAEMMADALRRKGVPFAYLAFEGEQHGFRQAPNIRRALEAELSFYGQLLGFEPADDIEPVEVQRH